MKFSIRFTVEEAAVGPVLAALNSHDGVVFDHLAIEPLTAPKPIPVPKEQTHRERRAELAAKKVAKPVTGRTIVRHLLAKEGPQGYDRIKAALVGRGFAGGGVGSLLKQMSTIYKEVEKLPNGDWALILHELRSEG